MVQFLALILGFQLLGEVIARGTGLAIPGPLIGMLLLFGVLLLKGGPGKALAGVADGLLAHLSLLFVPAGVGVIVHVGLIRAEGTAIITALVLSTLAGVAVTALVMKAMLGGKGDAG